MMVLFLLLTCWQTTSADDAHAAMLAKDYPRAVRIYGALAERDPVWLLNLGMAHFYAESYADAAKALEGFVRVKPAPGAAHLFLGVSRLKLQQPCEAIAPLEAALRWPERPQSRWMELADAYQGCKRWESAAKAYEQIAGEPRARRQAAHCWRMARRYDLAKPLFEALQKQYAGNAEFEFEYGDTLMRLDGAEAGLPWLQKAVASDGKLLPAIGALGRALLELGRAAEAIPYLETASREDPAALLALGRAYRKTGRNEDAARAEASYRLRMN